MTSYLQRIDYHGDLTPNLSVLRALQKQHLLRIPFENLDIHYGRYIELDTAAMYAKVMEQQRGGFCYELNTLFNQLLWELGFTTRIISGQVYSSEQRAFGPEYDHLAILVKLGDVEYLVDVGYGEFTFTLYHSLWARCIPIRGGTIASIGWTMDKYK